MSPSSPATAQPAANFQFFWLLYKNHTHLNTHTTGPVPKKRCKLLSGLSDLNMVCAAVQWWCHTVKVHGFNCKYIPQSLGNLVQCKNEKYWFSNLKPGMIYIVLKRKTPLTEQLKKRDLWRKMLVLSASLGEWNVALISLLFIIFW